MNITPVAPPDYERYAALYGLPLGPVEGRTELKSPQRSIEAAAPVSVEFNRRQAPNKAAGFSSPSTGNRGVSQEPVIAAEQKLANLSWLADYAGGLGDIGGGLNSPSPRKVAEIYDAQRNISPQIIRQSG